VIPPQPNTSKWGKRGSRIKDSNLVRDYCRVCADPIRVTVVGVGASSPACNRCSHTDRTRHGYCLGSWNRFVYWTDRNYHGEFYQG
jgi:hypothetical protein